MTDDRISYSMPNGRRLHLKAAVIAHFRRYRQARAWLSEAGGQLFGRLDADSVTIEEATGPRPGDRRSLFSFVPDRAAEQAEISARFQLGLHFLGDWHTHRERNPCPSHTDLASMRDMFRRSRHNLEGFLLVIVGTARFPAGLHVSTHMADGWTLLTPVRTADEHAAIQKFERK